jgi:hypothetical protein
MVNAAEFMQVRAPMSCHMSERAIVHRMGVFLIQLKPPPAFTISDVLERMSIATYTRQEDKQVCQRSVIFLPFFSFLFPDSVAVSRSRS